MVKAIVIGSGMAGLTSAAYLCRAGYDVTVFEQWDHIGGVTATIHQDGYSWDLGPMLIEGISPHEKLGMILTELGLDKKLNLIRDERWQSFPDFELRPPNPYTGPEWRLNLLKTIFPGEMDGLDAYYKIHYAVMKLLFLSNQLPFKKGLGALITKLQLAFTFMKIKKYKDWTAAEVTDHFFKDQRLKDVFLAILADMVVKPSEFSGFGISVFNPDTAYDKRVLIDYKGFRFPEYQYIENGVGELVKIFESYILAHGGKIHINSKVTKILSEHHTVKGILLESGEKFDADLVLASGGMFNTFFHLVGKDLLTQDAIRHIERAQLTESVLMVHIGIDFDPSPYQENPLVYYYRFKDLESTLAQMREGIYHEGKSGFLIYILSKHSPKMAPLGKHAITIYTVVPSVLKESNWTEKREEYADKLLIEAEKIIPGLRDHTQTRVIITPDDFKNRLNVKRHAFGGFAPVLGQENFPYRTPIKNLWFIGQFSESGAGVFGTAAGARECVKTILKENTKKSKAVRYLGDRSHGA